jgi:hypothetical protein
VVFFVATFNRGDFMVLQELLEAGKVTPMIDRRYVLSELRGAPVPRKRTRPRQGRHHGVRDSSRAPIDAVKAAWPLLDCRT